MPPRIAKMAGVGAFGACAGLLAAYLGLAYLTRPGALGGIDSTSAVVAWISLGGVFVALIVLHIALGKQLLRLAQGDDVRHPL